MKKAPARKLSPREAARAQLDLFGEVPITRQDVYAWLLAVIDLDPASFRAFDYVRTYGVLNKIMQAKLNGTFEEMVKPAKHSARLQELANGRAVEEAENDLGLGEYIKQDPLALRSTTLRTTARPKEVISREMDRVARERKARRNVDATMLRQLPKSVPPLSVMLADIGSPAPAALAGAFDVSESTVRRWLNDDDAPKPVLLALFWLTRWGVSQIDAKAHNDAVGAAAEANRLQRDVDALQAELSKVAQVADFGSANDPTPSASGGLTPEIYEVPAGFDATHQAGPQLPIRSEECAESTRQQKQA